MVEMVAFGSLYCSQRPPAVAFRRPLEDTVQVMVSHSEDTSSRCGSHHIADAAWHAVSRRGDEVSYSVTLLLPCPSSGLILIMQ